MKSEYSVAELVPHSGRMSLLDKIVDYGEDWLQAEVNITADSMFAEEQGVPGWIGLEYLAQAIGAFAGLQERQQGQTPRLGFLLGSRKYLCSADYFALGDTLSLKVTRSIQAENGLSAFECSLKGQVKGSTVEASASLNVYQPDDAGLFLREESE